MLHTLSRDLRFALRTHLRRPAFAMSVVAILAIGIGSATGMLSIARTILTDSLPYPHAERLVQMYESKLESGMRQVSTSYQNFLDWRDRTRSFESMAVGYFPQSVVVRRGAEAETLTASLVSPAFFDITGASAMRGRLFGPEADRSPAAHPVAVIAHSLWTERFEGDPDIAGRTIDVNGRPYTVVGVMLPGFQGFPNFVRATDLWLPIQQAVELIHPNVLSDRILRTLPVIARLHESAEPEQVRAELDALAAQLGEAYPTSNAGWRIETRSVREMMLGSFEGPVLALLAGAVFLLLIGCANVASLLLVRSGERRREIALRVALGGSRASIARQLVVEASLLSFAAALAGTLLAYQGVRTLVALSPIPLPPFLHVEIDGAVLAATLLIAVSTGVLFGLVPLLGALRVDLKEGLGGNGKGIGGETRREGRTRQVLVVAEVATAVILLIGAGLLIRSVEALRGADLGFSPHRLLTMSLKVSSELRTDEEVPVLARQLIDEAASVPGIEAASVWAPHIPGAAVWFTSVRQEDRPELRDDELTLVRFHYVHGNALPLLGVRIIEGRGILPSDRADSEGAIVLSESAAAALWPSEPALGKRLRRWNRDLWVTVVGIAADALQGGRQGEPGEFTRDVYFAYEQEPQRDIVLMASVNGDPAAATASLRGAIQGAAPDLPVFDIQPLTARLSDEERTPRFTAMLAFAYSFLALLLAAMGLYSVLAYAVSRRRREIGLRMALGAWPRAILGQITGHGLALAGIGALIGVGAAWVLTGLMGSVLYGVSPHDPATFFFVPVLLLIVVALASVVPARRATRVDPMIALRND